MNFKRKHLKVLMMFGIPSGIWFTLWGIGSIVQHYNLMLLEIPSTSLPTWLAGACTIFMSVVILGFLAFVMKLMYEASEIILKGIENKMENRRINRLSQFDSDEGGFHSQHSPVRVPAGTPTPPHHIFNHQDEVDADEDQQYRQRIGVEE